MGEKNERGALTTTLNYHLSAADRLWLVIPGWLRLLVCMIKIWRHRASKNIAQLRKTRGRAQNPSPVSVDCATTTPGRSVTFRAEEGGAEKHQVCASKRLVTRRQPLSRRN